MQFRYRFRIEPTTARQAMPARTFGCRLVVEVADELVRDMTGVLVAMYAQLFGRGSVARRAAAAGRATQAGIEDPW